MCIASFTDKSFLARLFSRNCCGSFNLRLWCISRDHHYAHPLHRDNVNLFKFGVKSKPYRSSFRTIQAHKGPSSFCIHPRAVSLYWRVPAILSLQHCYCYRMLISSALRISLNARCSAVPSFVNSLYQFSVAVIAFTQPDTPLLLNLFCICRDLWL